ncbi:RNA-binding protein Prp24 [Coprinopsis sp. MPI-PUGE-AT-0042]|nr:RNA-binding protein Prp24 [Coprinopsis sp. MPI-PUGE-AT-0042]
MDIDESKQLEELSNVLNQIAENPLKRSLHLRHIEVAKSLGPDDGSNESLVSAYQMMVDLLPVPESIWLAFIQAKEKSLALDTEKGVTELLDLYNRAEVDYLSIPVLRKHLDFLLENHRRYHGGEEPEPKPAALGDTFSTVWTLLKAQDVLAKGTSHISQSYQLFDPLRDWVLEQLEEASAEDKPLLLDQLETMLNLRLKQPHSNSDETFQTYSSFTTRYKAPTEYEGLMVTASKTRGNSVTAYERRDSLETSLAQNNNSLDAFAYYIAFEKRSRNPDLLCTRGVYERAIAEAATRVLKDEPGAVVALESFWAGYLDSMRQLEVGIDDEQELYRRALRSASASGEVWARYIRFLERASELMEGLEPISAAYTRATLSLGPSPDLEQVISLALAYGSWEKRRLVALEGEASQEAFGNIITALETALEVVKKASKTGDPKFRLEKFLTGVYETVGLGPNAAEVWETASKKYKGSYAVWLNYTDTLIKHQEYDTARQVFTDVHTKRMDWPEAIWEAWVAFEHLHGSVDDITSALDKIEKARTQLNNYRAREMQKAYEAQAAQQPAPQAKATAVPSTSTAGQGDAMAVDAKSTPSESTGMDVDAPATSQRVVSESKKRQLGNDDDGSNAGESLKRARFEPNPATLKRDRENATVFVADLPAQVSEDELKALFKDCGKIREVKVTHLPTAIVALVEFYERDSVPGALTKDKKRVQDQEISVHLAWKSTLYVTNFPETADDAFIRELFATYGTLFDVRWPSKKFKNTRRFCYVQFTSPDAALQALELHGKELEPNLPLNVYVSNPERKKERTDQDANEREIYVAGLSKFTAKADLEKLFSTYGKVKEVRMATEDNGHARGYAFVEYDDPQDARRALDANNYELKKRRIAVTLADPRVRARHNKSDTGLARSAEVRRRSVRVKNLPPNTQEGLLQQAFEKIAAVKRVEVFADKNEAVVELETTAEAGKLLLRTEPIVFGDKTLQLSEDGKEGAVSTGPPPKAGGMFVPRRAGGSRPRAGLGHARAPPPARPAATGDSASPGSTSGNRGQDDFRKMLLGGK